MYCYKCTKMFPCDPRNPSRICGCGAIGTLTPRDLLSSPYTRVVPTVREPQVIMAELVNGAIHDAALDSKSRILAIEAPTGTGKTLAYLAATLDKPGYTIISASTKNLQLQIDESIGELNDDIKKLTGSRATTPGSAILKGVGNYYCPKALKSLDIGEDTREEIDKYVGTLYPPVYLSSALEYAPPHLKASLAKCRVDVSAPCTTSTCSARGECSYFEQLEKLSLKESRVVVINHALLMSSIRHGGSFGDPDTAGTAVGSSVTSPGKTNVPVSLAKLLYRANYIIIDEAHQLLDYAVSAYTDEILLENTYRLASDFAASAPEGAVRNRAVRVQRCVKELLEYVVGLCSTGEKEKSASIVLKNSPALLDIVGRLCSLHSLLLDVEACTLVPHRRLLNDLRTLSTLGDLPGFNTISVHGSRHLLTIKLPISKSAIQWKIRGKVLTLTSGTLVQQTKNELHCKHISVPLGLNLRKEDVHILPSVFNYDKQCVFFIPTHNDLDPSRYRAGAAAKELYLDYFAAYASKLLEITKGGAAILFGSRVEMMDVHKKLSGVQSLKSMERFVQTPHIDTGDLSRRFEETSIKAYLDDKPGPVLFGLHTFWEGFSVEGPALRNVIIAKMRFPRPDDPQILYLNSKSSTGGRSTFNTYSIPQAIKTLRQAEGRLLRTEKDYGIVSLFDTRVSVKRYGATILKELSTCTPVSRAKSIQSVRAKYKKVEEAHNPGWKEEYKRRQDEKK